MSENKGWDLLNGVDNNGGSGTYLDADGSIMNMLSDGSVQYIGADGSYGYKGADGSGYYSGADGSIGSISSDGSGHYFGADGSFKHTASQAGSYITDDGSIVNRSSDGSAQYIGADGSFGYKNADGSGYYSGADGSFGNRSAREREAEATEDASCGDDTYSYSGHYTDYPASISYQSTRKKSASRASRQSSGIIGTIFSVVAVPFTILLILGGMLSLASRLAGCNINADNKENHPGEIKLEYSASHYKGENYYDTIIDLRNLGFCNIEIFPLNDLKAGIFSKEGSIETIEIDGLSDFQADTWISEKSVVKIYYHSFAKKDKNGFNTDKNNHLVIYGIDIPLPNYLIEDSLNDTKASYHAKKDEETELIIFNSEKQVNKELEEYGTFFQIDSRDFSSSNVVGKEIEILGKKNDEVYSVFITTLESQDKIFYILLVSPCNCKTDYYSDYRDILSGIYVPKDTEIRIDFISKDYKGKSYEDAIADLKCKGFSNIKTENLQDVVVGIFTKAGAIEEIMINGRTDYKIGDWIDKDTEILITYHGK